MDEDCAANQYCNAGPHTCSVSIASGQPLPSEGLYATCGTDGTNAACASGRCDASVGLCGAPIGATCSAAAACASGTCDDTTRKCATCEEDSQCTGELFCSAGGGCLTPLSAGSDCARDAQCDSSECKNTVCAPVAVAAPGTPVTFELVTPENTGCSFERAPAGHTGTTALGAVFALAGLGALRRLTSRRPASSHRA